MFFVGKSVEIENKIENEFKILCTKENDGFLNSFKIKKNFF